MVDFIQAFLKSSAKVTAAISIAAVPASPDGTTRLCCPLLRGCWLGGAALPPQLCTPCALVPLAMSPASHCPFLSLSPGCQEETEKTRFLECICTLCRTARHKGLLQGLDVFCHRFELTKSIKVRRHPGRGQGPPSLARCEDSVWAGANVHGHPKGTRVPLRSPASKDPSTRGGRDHAGSAGTGCWCLPGPLSQLCSAGAAGRGAQGPPVHGGAAARHGCHCRLEVPAHPSWGPLPRRSMSTCPRPRGTAPSTGVPTDPSLSLQLGGDGAGGPKEKPHTCLLHQCLLASSRRGHAGPGCFPLLPGKRWVSPQSLWAAPWLPCARRRLEIQGRSGSRFCFPPLIPSSPSRGPSHIQAFLPRGLPQAPQGSVGVLLGAGSSDPAPGSERDCRKMPPTLCPPSRPWMPWTACYACWCSALLPPASARSCTLS